jgi:hypothetical protein
MHNPALAGRSGGSAVLSAAKSRRDDRCITAGGAEGVIRGKGNALHVKSYRQYVGRIKKQGKTCEAIRAECKKIKL